MRTIHSVEIQGEAVKVVVETHNAYHKPTKSGTTSRFDTYLMPLPENGESLVAIDWLKNIDNLKKSINRLKGLDIDVISTDTKDVFLNKLRNAIDDWQRIQAVRLEAEARGVPQAAINDVVTLEDARWNAVVNLVQKWRASSK